MPGDQQIDCEIADLRRYCLRPIWYRSNQIYLAKQTKSCHQNLNVDHRVH